MAAWPWRRVCCSAGAGRPPALLCPKITRRTNAAQVLLRRHCLPPGAVLRQKVGVRVRRRNTMKAKVAALVLGLAAAGVLLAPAAGFVSLG